jgi:hypothetical protein
MDPRGWGFFQGYQGVRGKALTLALSQRERGPSAVFVRDSPTCDFRVERKF